MNEFVPIKDFERYEINKDGVIRNATTKAIKSQYVGSTGYYTVSFSYKNKSMPKRVHRMLLLTFIPNTENKKCINHKNGNKLDNRIENLEWCDHQENMEHAFKTGLANNTGENNGQSKLTEEKVRKIKKMLKEGITQKKIADMFEVSRSCILGIHIKRLWKHV